MLEVATEEKEIHAAEEAGFRPSRSVSHPAHVIIADDNHHFTISYYALHRFYILNTVALRNINAHSVSFRPNRKTWRCRRKGVSVCS